MHETNKSHRFSRFGVNRRKFVGLAGAAAGLLASTHCLASSPAGEEQRVLELLHKVYHRFAEHYGTVLCRDVRKGAKGNCPEVVGRAARWVAEVLLAEFAGYQVPQTESGQEPQRAS